MLIADVSQLLEHVGETQEIDMPYELKLVENDYKLSSPVKIKLTLISTGKSILAQGMITGEIEATCARCLNPYKHKFQVGVEEEYKRTADIMSTTAKDKELGDEDFVFTIDSEGRIDLSELIRQNIVVNLPLKFICSNDCKGIDKGAYAKEKRIDPRLNKLNELKERK